MTRRACIVCGAPGGVDGWCGACCMDNVVADVDADDAPPSAPKARVVPLATAAKKRPPRIELELPTSLLGRMLGGISRGAAVLVHGPQGSGKTTDAIGFAAELAEATGRRALVVEAEMPAWRVADAARRAGADADRIDVAMAPGGPMPELPNLAPFAAVVLDSVTVLARDDRRETARIVRETIEAGRRAGVVTIAIAHEKDDGKTKGGARPGYDVDVEARITRTRAVLVKTREDCRALEERVPVKPRRAARSSRLG